MPKKQEEVHASLQRLFEVARASRGEELSKADLARDLDELPQTITNWGARGVSTDGAIKAEVRYRARAAYILGLEPATSSTEGRSSAVVQELPTSVSRRNIAVISANLAHPEAAMLLRMVQAAKAPGVNVEVKKWKEISGDLGHGKKLASHLGPPVPAKSGSTKRKAGEE